MKTLFFKSYLPAICILFYFSSCKTDPVIPNEEEVITTLNYYLVNSSGDTSVFSFTDLDGDGGNPPVITTDSLSANTTYTGTISFLNETESPSENITDEVIDEAESHQVFYSLTLNNATVAYTDADNGGKPLGITTNFTTGNVEQGTMTIVLRHNPDKNAVGVSNGLIDNAGGETDIEVTFSVDVH